MRLIEEPLITGDGTDLLLIRHCAALGQEPEAALSVAGEAQALELANFLAKRGVVRIISSPYQRALDSARPLAHQLGLAIEVDARLAERRLGDVEDGDWIAALRRSFEDLHLCLPGGESSTAAQLRGRAVIDEAFAASNATVAIFSHGNLLSLIASSFDTNLGFDFWASFSNPDVILLRNRAESCELERIWKQTI